MAVVELNLGSSDSLPRGKRAVFELPDGTRLLVLNTRKGLIAIENRCPHAGASLAEGLLKGHSLMCVWHGWTFDLKTGKCKTHPGAALKQYAIRIHNNQILVSLEIKDDEKHDR